jgi:hypothetical protein
MQQKRKFKTMAPLPLIVFDVNETLLDLETMEPTFERISDLPRRGEGARPANQHRHAGRCARIDAALSAAGAHPGRRRRIPAGARQRQAAPK